MNLPVTSSESRVTPSKVTRAAIYGGSVLLRVCIPLLVILNGRGVLLIISRVASSDSTLSDLSDSTRSDLGDSTSSRVAPSSSSRSKDVTFILL